MTSTWLENLKILIIGFLGSLILRVVNSTLRWESVGLEGEERWWADGKPSILLFWHSRLLFMSWIYFRHRTSADAPALTALISQHSDGRMIASAMRFLGVQCVSGSSTRGGLKALYSLVNKLKDNSHIAITPDGPKGPPQKIKNGVIFIAQRSEAKIQPAAFAAEHYWQFRSWDKMIFPKPFSKAVFVKGSPLSIKKNSTDEEVAAFSVAVEEALNEVARRADNYFRKTEY
jgi:lysophospholipid acyltransferase (LPLAT)-like uncharacterized protein